MKKLLLTTSFCLLTLSLLGCNTSVQDSGNNETNETTGDTTSEIIDETQKIGVILPLSGPVSCFGDATKNAMLMAQEQAGEKGENFEIIFGDDQYEVQNGLGQYKKFLSVDKIDYLYVRSANSAKALQNLVQQDGVSSLMYSPDETICHNNESCSRIMPKVGEYTNVIFDTIRENGMKKVAVIDTQDERLQNFSTSLLARNGDDTIVFDNLDSFERGETNFAGVIQRIMDGKYDAVVGYLSEGSMGSFNKQLVDAGFKGLRFGSDYSEGKAEREVAAGAMDGVMRANTPSASEEFLADYVARFGNNEAGCLPDAVKSYDVFAYIFNNYDTARDTTINDTLQRLTNYTAQHGVYTYTEDGKGDKYLFNQPVLKTIQNNQVVEPFTL